MTRGSPSRDLRGALPEGLRWCAGIFFIALLFSLASLASAQAITNGKSQGEKKARILLDEREFVVEAADKARYRVHRIVEVLGEAGKEHGDVVMEEGKYVKCKDVRARITDPAGKELRKLDKDEMHTTSLSGGSTLFDDAKHQWFELRWSTLPYVVEYSYEQECRSLFFWPEWFPQEEVPVSKASYTLRVPSGFSFNTHSTGIDAAPVTREEDGRTIYRWELADIEPKIDERFMPPENEIQMALRFAPSSFELDGYPGSFSSWEAFGIWYQKLLEGRSQLGPDACAEVKKVLRESSDLMERIEKLYANLQSSTRYVAIAMGIGGWQPHSAQSVFENRYGDCKDLSLFMVSMLREIGVESHLALVRTRDEGVVLKDFPSNQFNHAIALVPFGQDTMWLECTADLLPAGELPYTDEGCDVLVMKGGTCEFARTPESTCEENAWAARIEGRIDASGGATISASVRATGNQCNFIRSEIAPLDSQERHRWLTAHLGQNVPGFDLLRVEIAHLVDDLDLPVVIELEGKMPRLAGKSGKRMFLNPNIWNRETSEDAPKEGTRHFPRYYIYAYTDRDSVSLSLPDGCALEHAPEPCSLDTSFGAYHTAWTFSDGILKYSRMLQIKKKIIPESEYGAYTDFMSSVIKNDKSQFVFVLPD